MIWKRVAGAGRKAGARRPAPGARRPAPGARRPAPGARRPALIILGAAASGVNASKAGVSISWLADEGSRSNSTFRRSFEDRPKARVNTVPPASEMYFKTMKRDCHTNRPDRSTLSCGGPRSGPHAVKKTDSSVAIFNSPPPRPFRHGLGALPIRDDPGTSMREAWREGLLDRPSPAATQERRRVRSRRATRACLPAISPWRLRQSTRLLGS